MRARALRSTPFHRPQSSQSQELRPVRRVRARQGRVPPSEFEQNRARRRRTARNADESNCAGHRYSEMRVARLQQATRLAFDPTPEADGLVDFQCGARDRSTRNPRDKTLACMLMREGKGRAVPKQRFQRIPGACRTRPNIRSCWVRNGRISRSWSLTLRLSAEGLASRRCKCQPRSPRPHSRVLTP